MMFGDVYYFTTTQAVGHAFRDKYQLYVCEPNYLHEHLLLFISSRDFGGDFKILREPDHTFLTKPASFVNFGTTVKMPELDPTDRVGRLHEGRYDRLYRAACASPNIDEFKGDLLLAMHEATTRHEIEKLKRRADAERALLPAGAPTRSQCSGSARPRRQGG